MKYNKIEKRSELFQILESLPKHILYPYLNNYGKWSSLRLIWTLRLEAENIGWKMCYKIDNPPVDMNEHVLPILDDNKLEDGIIGDNLEDVILKMKSWLEEVEII